MIEQLWTARFLISCALGALALILAFLFIRQSFKPGTKNTFPVHFIKGPTSSSLTILGILIPLLVGAAAYFYINQPKGDYGFLWAGIFLLFAALSLTIWFAFSTTKIKSTNDEIALEFHRDLKYVAAFGLMYVSLLLAFVTLALFFLFDLPSFEKKPAITFQSSSVLYLAKPRLRLGISEDEVTDLWGAPGIVEDEPGIWYYGGSEFDLILQFDDEGLLSQITEQRK